MEHRKKVGILTFHAAHNYGAMLQAYALQQTVMSLGYDCELINFRSQRQIDQYKPFYRQKRLLAKLKAARHPSLAMAAHNRYNKFEAFLENDLRLSPQKFASLDELMGLSPEYDAYICGSDQIWNPELGDYDDAFLLPFVKRGRRISYAASMGRMSQQLNQHENSSFRKYLPQFDTISVREKASADVVKKICGKEVPVVVDPTLLLNAEAWNKLAGSEPLVSGEYILFYTPLLDINLYHEAIEVAEKLRMKLVITSTDWYRQFHNILYMEYHVNSGPREFLNLVKYSKMVIGASFHAVVFSIIFGKQFYAIDGMNDARISNILFQLSLERFTESPETLLSDSELISIYGDVKRALSNITDESRAFLHQALSD